MRAYQDEFRDRAVQDAMRIGTCRAAQSHGISPQTLVKWLHQRGLSVRTPAPQKVCVICGKTFKHSKGRNRICCSRVCRDLFDHETRNCRYCDKPFAVIKSKSKKYCSHKCYALSNRKESKEKKRRGSNWNTLRRRFKENPSLCVMCGQALARDLHHIIPYKYFNGDWKRANKKQNLASLCLDCHIKAERYVRQVYAVIELTERSVA